MADEKLWSVYVHINKENGKRYVGITSKIPERRWGVDGCNYRENSHFYSAIQKYGWDNFEHQVLMAELTANEAKENEKRLICCLTCLEIL